jgi:threonine dehydrogenase-like Zn-dependent dehydrogenase
LLVREARLGDSILPIPEGIPYDVAAMCEPLAVAMHGVNRMAVKSGDKVVVFGCGPIGLGMILWLIDRGVTDVVALICAGRRERAMALGARTALDPPRSTCVPSGRSCTARCAPCRVVSRRRRLYRCSGRAHPRRRHHDGQVPSAW